MIDLFMIIEEGDWMRNLYVKTFLIYFLLLIVFLISVLVWDFFFFVFVFISAIMTKGRSFLIIKKEELTFPYILFQLCLMCMTITSLFLIVRAVS